MQASISAPVFVPGTVGGAVWNTAGEPLVPPPDHLAPYDDTDGATEEYTAQDAWEAPSFPSYVTGTPSEAYEAEGPFYEASVDDAHSATATSAANYDYYAEVKKLLATIHLPHLLQLFRDNSIDDSVIGDITDEHLKNDLGIREIGVRLKLNKAILALHASPAPSRLNHQPNHDHSEQTTSSGLIPPIQLQQWAQVIANAIKLAGVVPTGQSTPPPASTPTPAPISTNLPKITPQDINPTLGGSDVKISATAKGAAPPAAPTPTPPPPHTEVIIYADLEARLAALQDQGISKLRNAQFVMPPDERCAAFFHEFESSNDEEDRNPYVMISGPKLAARAFGKAIFDFVSEFTRARNASSEDNQYEPNEDEKPDDVTSDDGSSEHGDPEESKEAKDPTTPAPRKGVLSSLPPSVRRGNTIYFPYPYKVRKEIHKAYHNRPKAVDMDFRLEFKFDMPPQGAFISIKSTDEKLLADVEREVRRQGTVALKALKIKTRYAYFNAEPAVREYIQSLKINLLPGVMLDYNLHPSRLENRYITVYGPEGYTYQTLKYMAKQEKEWRQKRGGKGEASSLAPLPRGPPAAPNAVGKLIPVAKQADDHPPVVRVTHPALPTVEQLEAAHASNPSPSGKSWYDESRSPEKTASQPAPKPAVHHPPPPNPVSNSLKAYQPATSPPPANPPSNAGPAVSYVIQANLHLRQMLSRSYTTKHKEVKIAYNLTKADGGPFERNQIIVLGPKEMALEAVEQIKVLLKKAAAMNK